MLSSRFALRRVPRFYWIAALLLLAVGIWSAATGTLLAKPGGDGQIDYLPSRVLSAQIYRHAALPLWNPRIFSGMPHIAIVQTAPFYPPNIILYALLPSTVAFNLTMLLHVLLLLGFGHAFFRLLTERDTAAWLGAMTFGFCGFLMLHLEAIGLFNSAVWIPAVFYCVEKWIRTLRWKYCALGGVCLAMQVLAGWPQFVLLSAIYLAVCALSAWREEPRRARVFTGLLVMGLLSAGLSAPVVLPTMDFKPYSNLAALTYSHFVSNSVAPQSLVLLLFPYLMGADWTAFHPVTYFGANQLVVTASYVGVLPLMLAVAALPLWRASRYVRFAAASALLSVLLSFGGFTPLGRVLYHLPVYNFFRDHRVNLVFFAFSIATLAACAAGSLATLAPKLRARLSWLVPAGFLLVAAILLIKVRAIFGSINPQIAPLDPWWVDRLHQSMRLANSDMLIAWLMLLIAAIILRQWMKSPQSATIARLAVVFVLADLLWFGLTDQPHFSRGHASPAEQAIWQTVAQAAGGEAFRVLSLRRDRPFLSPNLNEIAGVDDIFGYSALYPGDYTDLLPFNLFGEPGFRELAANRAILSLLNTRFIFAGAEDVSAINRMFASGAAPSAAAATESSPNLLSPGGWTPLRPDQPLDPANPFRCAQPPCGLQQKALLLARNSVYQLKFGVTSPSRATADLDVRYFEQGKVWPPLHAFAVSNVLLSERALPYTSLYVTGDRDQLVDLRFSANSSAKLQLSDVSLTRVATLPLGPNPWRAIAEHDGVIVLENQEALPRAFFVSQLTRVAGYAEARHRLWDPARPFDPAKEALVEDAAGLPPAIAAGRVETLAYRPNHATLQISCPSQCFLVLADLALPGWQATLDGRPATIYRTDAVIRGLIVPAGMHSTEFTYRPPSTLLGLAAMLFTAVIVLLMWRQRHAALS